MRWAIVTALLVGCYHPHIGDGSFQCGADDLCPEGFRCNADEVCVQKSDGEGPAALYKGQLGAKDLSTASGTLECSTRTGTITLVGTDMSQTVVVAPGADGFVRLAQTSGPLLAVWSFESLAVPAAVAIKPTSDSDAMPVFAASGAITIEGSLTWRGYGGFHGLAGEGGRSVDSEVLFSGGGGAIHGSGGGGAGYGNLGSAGVGAGAGGGGLSYGTNDLSVLHAGSGGGGGGSIATGAGGIGGNGGGAVALLSQTSIALSGAVDVSGDDGTSGDADCGGGGGGSGGSILLSAPTIALHDGHALYALGGNGGPGVGLGGAGGAGAVGRIYAAGRLTADDMLVAQPAVNMGATPVTSFPADATISR